MSEIRARYDGPSGTGVDVPVALDTGEIRNVHVDQGGQLPADVDGTPISAKFRDSLLEQDTWSEAKPAGSDKPAKGEKE